MKRYAHAFVTLVVIVSLNTVGHAGVVRAEVFYSAWSSVEHPYYNWSFDYDSQMGFIDAAISEPDLPEMADMDYYALFYDDRATYIQGQATPPSTLTVVHTITSLTGPTWTGYDLILAFHGVDPL